MDICRLVVDVTVGTEVIGRGETRALGSSISLRNDGHLPVEVPVSPAAIRHVEETARGTDVSLRVAFQGSIRYRRAALLSSTGQLAEPSGPWEELHHGIPGARRRSRRRQLPGVQDALTHGTRQPGLEGLLELQRVR